eukprot:1147731-Pelagomonas_calceolata.AAC.2
MPNTVRGVGVVSVVTAFCLFVTQGSYTVRGTEIFISDLHVRCMPGVCMPGVCMPGVAGLCRCQWLLQCVAPGCMHDHALVPGVIKGRREPRCTKGFLPMSISKAEMLAWWDVQIRHTHSCARARTHTHIHINLLVVVNEAAARNLNHLMLDTAGPSTALRQGLQAGGVDASCPYALLLLTAFFLANFSPCCALFGSLKS